MKQIIAITGPSSSGKTKLSIEVAKEINGEIISVDSRQIYKELNIGTAKPSFEEREGIIHHLIDITDVNKQYTAANFADDAQIKINEIINRGHTPILSGGTGLYFRVLLQDFELPRVQPDIKLREKYEAKSSPELYELLKKSDPLLAEKIHYNNKVKIIRALEVIETLGIPMSQAQKKKQSQYNTLWFGLNASNREFLYNRINIRTDEMIKQGLTQEAEYLFKKYPDNNILLNTIGYQEYIPFFNSKISLNDTINMIKQNTRRYAKRQISWFLSNKSINWLDIESYSIEEMKNKIAEKYQNNS